MVRFVSVLALAMTMASPLRCPVDTVRRPHNVVLVVVDDLGVDMVGAYEPFYDRHPHPDYPNTTPSMDYLASTGRLFLNAWTDTACSPTRAQILTGKHGLKSGIGRIVDRRAPGKGAGLQRFQDTIPSVVRNGPVPYHTAAVGKWHLADGSQHPPSTGRLHPLGSVANPWFHQYAGSMYNLNPETYNDWTKTFGTPIIPGKDECTPSSWCSARNLDYATADTVDDAIHLVQTMPEPFFLYLAFNAPHRPLNAPARPLTPGTCSALRGNPICEFTNGADVASDSRCMVQWLDNELGRLLCAIEESPLRPDGPTTIVLIGDNGTRGSGTAPAESAIVAPFDMTHRKGTLYQGGVNVPLIIKSPIMPARLAGQASKALVNSTDLFATVADLAGASVPPDPHELRESHSLVPIITGRRDGIREYVYAEEFTNNFTPTPRGEPPPGYTAKRHTRAIRNVEGFKLIHQVTRDGSGGFEVDEEFYALEPDPHEQDDLISRIGTPPYDEPYADLRRRLDSEYPHLVAP